MGRPVGIILLAAGGSTRMGKPKQLLPFGERSLVRHSAETAIATRCGPIVIVLGSDAVAVSREVGGLPVHLTIHPQWDLGMGTSVAAGVQAMVNVHPDVSAAVLMVCDQPLVTPELLSELVTGHRRYGRERCACAYAGKLGVPALFAASWFPRLQTLQKEGASRLLSESPADVFAVPFPGGEFDVDTPEEYAGLGRLPRASGF